MKIALVIFHADHARGGAERYTIDLAAALVERGHEVWMLATSFACLPPGVRSVPLHAPGATRLMRYMRFLDALDIHLADHSYDVVHAMLPVRRCDLYHPHAGIAADAITRGHLKHHGALRQAAARLANRLNRKRRRFAAVERGLLMNPGGPMALCLSQYVKQSVRAHYPLPESRLATLLNAADLKKFDPLARPKDRREVRERFGIAPDRIVALMIAQDFARKGLRETLAALRMINDDRLVLLVAGKGDPRPYARAASALPAARVIFAGPTNDPYAFYQAADFFVLPTRHDPCSLVVLEALAMGLPVVSTVFNGACEVMEPGRQGTVLRDPGDIPALASAMRGLLDDKHRHAQAAACLALRPRLAYEHHIEQLLEIYRRINR